MKEMNPVVRSSPRTGTPRQGPERQRALGYDCYIMLDRRYPEGWKRRACQDPRRAGADEGPAHRHGTTTMNETHDAEKEMGIVEIQAVEGVPGHHQAEMGRGVFKR